MFDPRLDLSFEEFCEYLKTGSAPSGPSGGHGAEKHGKTLGVYDPSSGSVIPMGSAPTAPREVTTLRVRWLRRVPENTGGDRPKGILDRIRGVFGQ